MSRKRNAANLKLQDFKGDPAAARNVGLHFHRGPWGNIYYAAPATKIAKAQLEKYRTKKK